MPYQGNSIKLHCTNSGPCYIIHIALLWRAGYTPGDRLTSWVYSVVGTVTEETNDYFATRYWALKKSNYYFATRYWDLKKSNDYFATRN
jgi:hypothetical protein